LAGKRKKIGFAEPFSEYECNGVRPILAPSVPGRGSAGITGINPLKFKKIQAQYSTTALTTIKPFP
jgi:hypothetical protein